MLLRLTLIRHALTDWNASGRFQGAADVALNSEGRDQARRLAAYVARLEPEAVVYSSPLKRAVETAAIAFPGRELRLDARLKEIDFGEFEGKTQAENELHPGWATWFGDPYQLPAPGGESYAMLRARAVAWMEEVVAAGPDHVVAVTHSGTIQMLLAHVLGVEKVRWRKRIYLRHASVSRVLFRGDEVLVERVNDTRHLALEGGDPFLD
ncbi:MAG TPA: histidine phosphatase family protein [Trueperaceae bacterium]|nr:histidine phosphatase family protein [Trueperaceae bacterium]